MPRFILPIALVLLALSPLVLLASHLISLENLVTFFGRFHPVVLHLPIGIILLTALMETLNLVSRGKLDFKTRLPVFLGALSAVAAMTLGILLMQGEDMQGALVESHLRWGIATAVAAVIMLFLRFLPGYDTQQSIRAAFYATLFATCGVLTWASHQGASITHGESYLTDYAPWIDHDAVSEEDQALAQGLALPLDQRNAYVHLVEPIFAQKCYECHMAKSFKGNLVMDSYEGLIDGGSTGPSLVPGSIEESLLIARIHLPLADEEHMPPANKPQMTDEETKLVEWWIQAGAPVDQTLADLNPDEAIADKIDLVTASLLEGKALEEHADEHHEKSPEEIATLREPIAAAVEKLQASYPGVIHYIDSQSAQLTIRSFHASWTDEEITALEPVIESIVELTIPNNQLTPASLEQINRMVSLRNLDLRNSELGDDFVAGIQPNQLKRLNLFSTEITDESLNHLKSFGSLERLTVGGNEISPEAVESLQLALPETNITGNISLAAN
ncbi:MAG: c-type cytochrome domain-containing protein [Verrucomicrobiota bacterium]